MTLVKLKEESEILTIIARFISERYTSPMLCARVDAQKIIDELEKNGYAIGSFK